MLSKIARASIYSLVFLLPVFWLPFSFEPFELNKQYLLFFLVSLASVSWLAKMVLVDREIRFRKSALDVCVLAFLAVNVLSAVFSVDLWSSLFGSYGRFSNGLVGLLSLGAFYFLVVNAKREISSGKLIKIFLFSAGLAVLTAYLSVFGVWQRFLNSGSWEGLAVFLSVVAVFLTAKISSGRDFSLERLLLLFCVGLLAIIDSDGSWLVLLPSLAIFLGFSLWKKSFKKEGGRPLISFVLVVIAVLGLSADLPFGKRLARERVLDQNLSWQIAFSGATDSVKSVFLGSGPGTFYYDFAKEKPQSFNQNPFWQIRFDRGGSHLAEVLAVSGFLGLLSYLALAGTFLFVSYFNPRNWPLLLTLFALIVGQLVYYQNAVLAFAFWFFLALGSGGWEKGVSEKILYLKNIPALGAAANVVLAVACLGLISAVYFGARFYSADAAFAKTRYEEAVKLNPNVPQYWLALSQSYFQEGRQEMQNPAEERDNDYLQNRILLAVNSGKQAAEQGPAQAAVLENLAVIYRDIKIFAAGSGDWAVKYFEEALELEPGNPVLRTELAKTLTDPKEAEKELRKAITLKPDYVEAWFQLGRLYFNIGRLEDSISHLEKALVLSPNYSNALYSLGLAWQKGGDETKARDYFEKVLKLNPDNQEVKKKLEDVKWNFGR